MPTKTLNWNVSADVAGSGGISAGSSSIEVEAVDQISISIDPDGTPKTVNIQPGAKDGMRLLVIKSSLYTKDLSFKVGDSTGVGSEEIVIDTPIIFTGGAKGSISLFQKQPNQLIFKLDVAAAPTKATIDIFVARDATP